jgi:hypothetical protein
MKFDFTSLFTIIILPFVHSLYFHQARSWSCEFPLRQSNGPSVVNELIIKECSNREIPGVAGFLGQFWFTADMSKAQRLEFTRLENNDLIKRYGERVGPRKYNAVLLTATENQEILGYDLLLLLLLLEIVQLNIRYPIDV